MSLKTIIDESSLKRASSASLDTESAACVLTEKSKF
jgi:hypothetical protein